MKEKILKEIEKKIPDFKKYFNDWEFEKMDAEDYIDRIEWELDLIDYWKDEGYSNKNEVSDMINECGIRSAKYLLKKLYKIMESEK